MEKGHAGGCFVGMGNFFGCGMSGHNVRDFPNLNSQEKGSGQSSGSNEALKTNHFYVLRSRSVQETSPNVVTCMLKFLSIDVYALLDPSVLYYLLLL